MPQFAANLSLLYPELDFLDRFEAAALDGFQAVECLFPYAFASRDIADRLKTYGLQQVLINAPPGHWEAGERGLACLDGREAEFRAGVHQALDYAAALDCPRIHVLAGRLPAGSTRAALQPTYISRMRWAAAQAAQRGIDLLIEPINPRDMPGYFLNRQDQAHVLLAEVGASNLKVQMDLYHCQIVEGDLAMRLRKHIAGVGHIQIAGVPERHEPSTGEVNYSYLFDLIDELGYEGWIGCEYRPANHETGGTSAGLGWFKPYISN